MTTPSYKRARPAERWDAIVIGSGIGGLAAAALLARHAGKRVLVLERHYTPGGFTHVFKRPGFEWDVGVHYIGQIEDRGAPVARLFDEVTGGAVQWARMPDVYDRVFLGDRAYDLTAGRERFVDVLATRFPGSRAVIERYLAEVRRTSRATMPFFVDRTLPPSFARLVRPLLRAPARKRIEATVEEVVRPLVRDPQLFDVLTAQCGDYGLTPREASFGIHAMVAGHYLEGAFYPVGGSQVFAAGAERLITAAGGAVVTSADVAQVVIERGRAVGVRMADGYVLRAPVVISDAGLPATWLRLVPRDHAERTGWPARLAPIPRSLGHLCLYVGVRGTDAELGLDGTNLWIYPPGDRDEAFARSARDPDAPFALAYVSFPSAKDPTFSQRHPGRATVEVIAPAWFSWVERWRDTRWRRRGDDYEAFKARAAERLLATLLEHRPQLRGRIEHAELSTPLSTAHFAGYDQGEMYGLSHVPARFRLPVTAETEIPGLFVAGQDLVSCGVTGALFGGAFAAAAVMRTEWRTMLGRRHAPMTPIARPAAAAAPDSPRVAADD